MVKIEQLYKSIVGRLNALYEYLFIYSDVLLFSRWVSSGICGTWEFLNDLGKVLGFRI